MVTMEVSEFMQDPNCIPLSPALIAPAQNDPNNDPTPLFDWTDSNCAMKYDLQVDNNSDFSSPEIELTIAQSIYTPSTGLADGEYFFRVKAKSAFGKTSAWTSAWGFSIDTTPPPPPDLLAPLDNSFTNDKTPSFDWSDSPGAVEYDLQIDNNSDFSSPVVDIKLSSSDYTLATELVDGPYWWRVKAQDEADNSSIWAFSFKVTVDTKAPTTIANPVGGFYNEDISIILTSDEPTAAIFYTTDGSDPGPDSTRYSSEIPITASTTLKFLAQDAAGNKEEPVKTKTYTLDKIPPISVSLSSPTSGSSVCGQIEVAAEAHDNVSGSGIVKVDFYYDSTKIGEDTTLPYSMPWDTNSVDDGEYTLTAKGFDKAGNSATSTGLPVTIYNSPALTVDQAPINFDPNQTSKTLTITNTGASCSILDWAITIEPTEAGQWLSVDPDQGQTGTSAGTVVTLLVTRGGLPKGPYSAKVKIISNGGNDGRNKEIPVSMTIGNHCPVITSTGSGSASIGTPYTCDVEASDLDGDTLSFSLTTAPAGMSINSATGVIIWTPSSWGTDQVTVAVSDGVCMIEQSFGIAVAGGGAMKQNTTLSYARSPYVVKSNIVVSEGVTLTIEPGVELKFDSGTALWVDGTLIARGTDDAKITFTSAGVDWGYIYFSDKSAPAAYYDDGSYKEGSILEYCVVEKAGAVEVSNNGAIRAYKSSPFINHTIIKGSKAAGIYARELSGTLKITYCTISDNTVSGIYAVGGTVIISYNIISNNIAQVYGGGICVSGTATISNNTISNNTASYDGGGIYANEGATISNNIITSNIAQSGNSGNGGGIRAGNSTISNNNIISSNTAQYGGGICTYNSTVSNNIISSNTAQYGGGIYGYGIIFNNSIIRNTATSTGSAIRNVGRYSLKVNNNLISDNQMATGGNNASTIYIESGDSPFNSNNIFNNTSNTGYELYNNNPQGSADVDATNNWWGTTPEPGIEDWIKIYHWPDDATKGLVIYAPWSSAIRTDVPISPPIGFTVTEVSSGSVKLNWSANPEGDTKGYKIYYHKYTNTPKVDPPYDHVINVDKITSYTLNLTEGDYYITITAYDTSAEGTDDLFEGHESWYSDGVSVTLEP